MALALTIPTHELVKALAKVQGIVDKKNSQRIASQILLEVTPVGQLILRAADEELSSVTQHTPEQGQSGIVTVNGKQLFDILRASSAPQVTLKNEKKEKLTILSGKAIFHLPVSDSETFPPFPDYTQRHTLTIQAKLLLQLIERTVQSISQDETRPNLAGVYFHTPQAGLLRAVATDGHRLTLADAELEGASTTPHGVIIPKKACFEIKRLLQDLDEKATVRLEIGLNGVLILTDELQLAIRVIDGVFPNYQHVIPASFSSKVQLQRDLFIGALRRVALLGSGRMCAVQFQFSSDTLTLIAEDPQRGDAQEMIALETRTPLAMNVGFNARYVVDLLELMQTTHVMFELNDDKSPGLLRPAQDDHFLAIVMPMRL